MFHIVAMLDWVSLFTVPGTSFVVTLGVLAWMWAAAWYLRMSGLKLGLLMAALMALCFPLARVTPGWAVIAAAVVGWVVQLAGHVVWEKRSPAFVKNLEQGVVGPVYFVALLTGDCATTSAASAAAASRPAAAGLFRWPDATTRSARTVPLRSTTQAPTASTPISTPSPAGPDRLSCSGLAGRPVAPRAAASSASSPAASSSSTSDDTVPRVSPVRAATRARDTGSSAATVRSTRDRLCRRTVCWPAGCAA